MQAAFSQAKAAEGSMQCTAVHGNTRLLLVRWLAASRLLAYLIVARSVPLA